MRKLLPVVAVLSAAAGFLSGRVLWPGTPDYAGRVVRVAVPTETEALSQPVARQESLPGTKPKAERVEGRLTQQRSGQMKIDIKSGELLLKRHGPWVNHHRNGRKKSEGLYVDGKQHGLWTHWHENGRVKSQGEFHRGQAIGLHRHFHANGNPLSEAMFREGKADGAYTQWYHTGVLQYRGVYKGGQKHGLWSSFDADGNLTAEEIYANGAHAAPVRLFDPKGEFPPEAEALEKASVNGKYRNLIRKVAAPDEKGQHTGGFRDYGIWQGSAYKGHKDIPHGYWVYVYPYWYVWRDSTEGG